MSVSARPWIERALQNAEGPDEAVLTPLNRPSGPPFSHKGRRRL